MESFKIDESNNQFQVGETTFRIKPGGYTEREIRDLFTKAQIAERVSYVVELGPHLSILDA